MLISPEEQFIARMTEASDWIGRWILSMRKSILPDRQNNCELQRKQVIWYFVSLTSCYVNAERVKSCQGRGKHAVFSDWQRKIFGNYSHFKGVANMQCCLYSSATYLAITVIVKAVANTQCCLYSCTLYQLQNTAISALN